MFGFGINSKKVKKFHASNFVFGFKLNYTIKKGYVWSVGFANVWATSYN